MGLEEELVGKRGMVEVTVIQGRFRGLGTKIIQECCSGAAALASEPGEQTPPC